FVQRLEELRQAIMPVGMPVDNVAANELWRRVVERDRIGAHRDHKFWIAEPLAHGIADRKLLLHPRLTDMLAKDYKLLDRFGAQHAVDLIPEIIAAAQAPPVDPDTVTRDRQLRRKPERELVIFGRGMRDKHGLAQ